jgi:ribosomal protein S18 acetylase RimI-like enzyme
MLMGSVDASAYRLRPMREEDMPFLRRVYASTRREELAQTGWNPEQTAVFLQFQFDAQHDHYTKHYPDASFDVIEVGGEQAGRLYVSRTAETIRIIDIALLDEFRNRGLGATILQEILRESNCSKVPVSIHVEQDNPARRLYERLGFSAIGQTGIYYLMERPPGA